MLPFRQHESSDVNAPRTFSARTRSLLVAVPVVLVSTIAITLNLASPTYAQTVGKRTLKAKSTQPESTTAPTATTSTANSSTASLAPAQYIVVDGDTVSGIASRFGLSTAGILALNGLGWSATIFPGQMLTLSSDSSGVVTSAPQAPVSAEITRYVVASGDTISGIAGSHGISTDAVLSANGLDRASVIYPGQSLSIPDASASTSTSQAPAAAASATSQYTIVSGDTIAHVAERAGVSVQAVLDANQLGWSSIIYPGQVLTLPATGSVVAAQVPTAPSASASASVVTMLTPEMRRNAELIVSIGRSAGVSDYGLVIALAAAAQESGLVNVNYGDRDSLGLFQQRPSAGWGSAAQVLDPVHSTLAFFGGAGNPNTGITRGLLDIPNWESMTVTEAAQAVQISAHPNHYAKWEISARAWLVDLN
ncbi:LysM peptidoglycan-binding domain-containing protein [Leifsonia sp. A12D58]|uniref:muramidase family protein n=1 Tax=Leifsonia sp. A12D58 TaxID=3397674 RepID=UPI0039E1DB35